MKKTILILLVSFGAYNCASFINSDLSRRNIQELPQSTQTMSLSLKTLGYGSDSRQTVEDEFAAEIRRALENSQKFSKVSGVREMDPKSDFHTEVTVKNTSTTGDTITAIVTGFISGISLTILPGYERESWEFEYKLFQKGKGIKTYNYRASMHTWIQLLLIFLMPTHNPDDQFEKIINQTVENFIFDANQDGIFSGKR